MQTTLIKNNTSTAVFLACAQSGAMLYLHAHGSITYPSLDLEAEDVRGLLQAEFKIISIPSGNVDAHSKLGKRLENLSSALILCVQGRVGSVVVPTTFLAPKSVLDLTPFYEQLKHAEPTAVLPEVALNVFSGTNEFFVPRLALQKLQDPDHMIALAVQQTQPRSQHEHDRDHGHGVKSTETPTSRMLAVFVLTRQAHPVQWGDTFEISSITPTAGNFMVQPQHSPCAASCKTLPNVSLCTTTKASVVLLVISATLLFVALVAMPLYVVACRKNDLRK